MEATKMNKVRVADFKVGQLAYLELTGNAKRGKKKEELIQECVIEAVGRKFCRYPFGLFLRKLINRFSQKKHRKSNKTFIRQLCFTSHYIQSSGVSRSGPAESHPATRF